MHTSSYADVADVYEVKPTRLHDKYVYSYSEKERIKTNGNTISNDMNQKEITIGFANSGSYSSRRFPVYFTHHGPVMGKRNGMWLALKHNNRSLSALMQSWLRTKAKGFEEFKKVMNMRIDVKNSVPAGRP